MFVMGKATIKMEDMRSWVKTTVFSGAQWWWCFLTSSPTSCPWSSMAVWLQMLPLKVQWNVYRIEERFPQFHSFLTQFCECKTANPDRFVGRVISKLPIIIKNFKSTWQKILSVLKMTSSTLLGCHIILPEFLSILRQFAFIQHNISPDRVEVILDGLRGPEGSPPPSGDRARHHEVGVWLAEEVLVGQAVAPHTQGDLLLHPNLVDTETTVWLLTVTTETTDTQLTGVRMVWATEQNPRSRNGASPGACFHGVGAAIRRGVSRNK